MPIRCLSPRLGNLLAKHIPMGASIFGSQNGEGQYHKNCYTLKKIQAILKKIKKARDDFLDHYKKLKKYNQWKQWIFKESSVISANFS